MEQMSREYAEMEPKEKKKKKNRNFKLEEEDI